TKAADALKAMVSNTATVSRVINDLGENAWIELPIDQLVPGDLVKLAAGDMIPADLRIIQARDLFVAQASLTGESLPVEKVARTRDPQQMNPLECDTLCFMGTTVVSGTAQAIVTATGGNTWFGQLAGRVSEQESEPNAFQKGI
ncbi:magnesium-translocating P-type ATPase, partial [Serratia nevei]|nr:magnesium-translocating P-type ATPase [Serratia nevei]